MISGSCVSALHALDTAQALLEADDAVAAVVAALTAAGAAQADIQIAVVGPMTGQYATFGEQMRRGAEMAVQDINAAGGVLGNDVVLEEGDSGDTNQDIANPEVDRLLALNVDVIVGASLRSLTVTARVSSYHSPPASVVRTVTW